MFPRLLPLLLALLLSACSSRSSPAPPRGDAKLARAYLAIPEQVADTPRARKHEANIWAELERRKIYPITLVEGCVELLEEGTADERKQAVHLLGRLGNRFGSIRSGPVLQPLIRALNDPSTNVREEACYALRKVDESGRAAEQALLQVCRTDPSTDIRVIAAFGLPPGHETEVDVALDTGMRATNRFWLRQDCEDELDRRGKLRLPLPDRIYTNLTVEEYKRMRAYWSGIRRKTVKDGVVYIEVDEIDHHVPALREWYRVTLRAGEVLDDR
jgi:HEAT repeats